MVYQSFSLRALDILIYAYGLTKEMDSHFKISVDDVNVTREERNGKDRVIQKKKWTWRAPELG